MADPTRAHQDDDAHMRPPSNEPNHSQPPGSESQLFPRQTFHVHGQMPLQHQIMMQHPSIQHPHQPYVYPYHAPVVDNVYNGNNNNNYYVPYPNSNGNIYPSSYDIPHKNAAQNVHQQHAAILQGYGQGQVPENVTIGNASSSCSVVSTLTMAPSVPNANQNMQQPNNMLPIQQPTSQLMPPPSMVSGSQYQALQSQQNQSQLPPLHSNQTNTANSNRAVHRIHLPSIRHNYNVVQSAAAQQQCQVITVVKADGYGHGALFTACHLVEKCGAEAFAVATLEEGVALRKTLEENLYNREAPNGALNTLSALPRRVRILVLGAPVGYPSCFDKYLHYDIELMVSGPEVAASLATWMRDHESRKRAEVERAAKQRKEELLKMEGADHNPMRNRVVRQVQQEEEADGKKDNEGNLVEKGIECVQSISNQTHTTATATATAATPINALTQMTLNDEKEPDKNTTTDKAPKSAPLPQLQTKFNAATLTNVTGADLAREVRQILIGQRHAAATAAVTTDANNPPTVPPTVMEGVATDVMSASSKESAASQGSKEAVAGKMDVNPASQTTGNVAMPKPLTGPVFSGIEDAAKASRQRELRAIRRSQLQSDDSSLGSDDGKITTNGSSSRITPSQSRRTSALTGNSGEPPQIRKKLRWHALVDSGMGRLGFKTEQVASIGDTGKTAIQPANSYGITSGAPAGDGLSEGSISSTMTDQSEPGSPSPPPVASVRDTVSIIKELYDAEVHDGAAIEFYGMCTHMADANATSTYTNAQMDRFRSLLYRVRSAGIAVPTISTDNSAALLTTTLTHFDPHSILSHDTRGFVRTGGAIYGQRPAFKQLRAVSTLTATVKHVSVIQKGESVGYDRAYVAPTNVRIATLTIGFADGYPRELGNGVGKVSIRGETFPVAGNVCMDMMMVDLGASEDCNGTGAQIKVGDVAVLWGPEGTNDANVKESGNGLVPLAELASTLKTTQSALTCGLDKLRVQRQYVE